MDKAAASYEIERNIYDAASSAAQRPPPAVDFLELYAGTAKPTKFAAELQLRALQPLDRETGTELSDPKTQQEVRKAVQRTSPWLIVVGYPSSLYSLANENFNFRGQPEQLRQLRDDDRRMRRFVSDLLREQRHQGRFFLLENPQTSRLWQQQEILEIVDLPGVSSAVCHLGAFGAEAEGYPLRKPLRFLSNLPEMITDLSHKLSDTDLLYCEPVKGRAAAASHEYPDALGYSIAACLRRKLQELQPQRFGNYETFATARPVTEPEEWKPVFETIKKMFGDSGAKRPFLIDVDGDLGKQLASLFRMKVARIQATHTPMQRRIPMDIPLTARGAALLYNDGTQSIEVEALENVRFPKQRFDKPVWIGIFVYGDLTQEPKPTGGQLKTLPMSALPTDIRFEGLAPGTPMEVKRTVARLHLNMGHPSAQELTRLACYHGTPSAQLLDAIRKLRCSTCERLKLPQAPRPATTPSMQPRQFCDELQSDVVFVRTMTGTSVPILGIVDVATNFHQAACLADRLGETTFAAIERIWLRPYGLPVLFRCDPDTRFQGYCKDRLEALGIEVEFCPPEAHWTIATIERRNAVLRTILERMVDSNAATTPEEVEDILSATLHALNSSAMTKGRSAYQAVFGRVPRLAGGNLIGEPTSLASSPGDTAYRAELMRAEALRYLSEFAVERGVRRAILRKTKATAIADISPGQPCAYWRWRRKGVHKKGGSAMAKFLSWDPEHPGKQAWLRTGPTTTLVSAEQLRAAVGFENWVPSQEDIAMLKDGSQSLKDTVWEDQTGPGPKEDYIMDEFDIEAPALESLPPTPVVVPGTPIPPPVPRLDAHVQHYEHIHQNVNIHSPRYEQVVLQRFGEEPNRGRSRSRTPGTPRRARSTSQVRLPRTGTTATLTPALPPQPLPLEQGAAPAIEPWQSSPQFDENQPQEPQPSPVPEGLDDLQREPWQSPQFEENQPQEPQPSPPLVDDVASDQHRGPTDAEVEFSTKPWTTASRYFTGVALSAGADDAYH